jgi:formylglycine-generating enzyme required for sulfatase activity
VDFPEFDGATLLADCYRVQFQRQHCQRNSSPDSSPPECHHPMKLPRSAITATLLLGTAPLAAQQALEPISDTLPGTRLSWEMLPVAGGTVTVPGAAGPVEVTVESFWIGSTEVPWELFDVFYLRLDVPRAERPGVDARSRPSKPYGAPDRGFGHRGWPAISLTHGAAVRFASWLSERTGNRYAVATDAQWQRAADLAFAGVEKAEWDSLIWSSSNSMATSHRVATLAPDRLGLQDLLGNVGEWVTGLDGTPWLRGGSFLDRADSISTGTRARQDPSWNQTDPQVPKSRWWLSDGPFAGFRLVRIP